MNRWAERRLAGATAVSNRKQREATKAAGKRGGVYRRAAGGQGIDHRVLHAPAPAPRAGGPPANSTSRGRSDVVRLEQIEAIRCGAHHQARDLRGAAEQGQVSALLALILHAATPRAPACSPHTLLLPPTAAHTCGCQCISFMSCCPAVHKQQLRRQVVGRQGIGLRRQRSLLLCTGKPGRHAGPARRVNDGRALAWPGAAPNVALPAAPRSMQAAPPSPAAAYPPSSLPCQLSPPALPHPPPPATQTPTPHNHRQPRRTRHTPGRRPLPAHPGPAPGPGPHTASWLSAPVVASMEASCGHHSTLVTGPRW